VTCQAIREQRVSVARTQLEAGIKPASVAVALQVRFHVSRSTAYDDITKAHKQIETSEDGPASEELEAIDPADIQAQLAYHLNLALAQGDIKAATALVSAIDKAKRWNGALQTTASPYA
jgi:hypothetical protein